MKQTDVGAARSRKDKTPLIICESYDVLSLPELKTIPPLFFFCAASALLVFPFEAKAFW